MSQTLKMKAAKIGKMITAWEKLHFADLVKDAKSVAGFSPSANFEWDRIMLH